MNCRSGCPRCRVRPVSSRSARRGGKPGSCSRCLPHFGFSEVHLTRRQVAKPPVRLARVVEAEVALQRRVRVARSVVGVQTSYFTLLHGRSTNTLSTQRPLPSILIWRMPLDCSTLVKSANSIPDKVHKVNPYQLSGATIERPT